MRTVLVAGFFNQVLSKLDEQFAPEVKSSTIIWIRQIGQHGSLNLKQFKERLNDRLAAGSDCVLILLSGLRGKEHIITQANSIIEISAHRWPSASVSIEVIKDPGAVDQVIKRITEFGIPETLPVKIDLDMLRRRLNGRKVLCVRETNHTSFRNALLRAGFPDEAWGSVFEEETVNYGKLSSLISSLQARSASYAIVLYAWHGLKYMGSQLKCPIHQSGDVKGAIDRFKEWVTEAEH